MLLANAALWAASALVAVAWLKGAWFLLRCCRARIAYSRSPVPGPPNPSLFGHVGFFGERSPWTLAAWATQYGPLYKTQLLHSLVYVVADLDTASRISRKTGPGPYCPKPRELYQALDRAFSPPTPSILTAPDGPYWRAVRQGTAACFSMSNMKEVLPLVRRLTLRVTDRMAAVAERGGEFDVSDAAKRITSDVVGELLLAEEMGATEWRPSIYLEVFYPALKAQAALSRNPLHLWQLWHAEVRHQNACLRRLSTLMDDKLCALAARPPPPYTIAAHLLAVEDPSTGRPLSHDQLKSEIATFMGAGFETTSHAITWALALLALHPEAQERLHAELTAAGLVAVAAAPGAAVGAGSGRDGDGGAVARDLDASHLGRLEYLGAVAKEALRLCPPAQGAAKVLTEDAELLGYHLPKGSYIDIPLLALALSTDHYGKEATRFRPERWLEGSSPPPDPLTFMAGPRDCIGQNLAKLEMQVVLAAFVGRFRFEPGEQLAAEARLAAPVAALHSMAASFVTMQPKDGRMLLRVTKR